MVYLGASVAVICLWDNRSIRIPCVSRALISESPPDLFSFQLPNIIFPHVSNQHTQFSRFANITKLSTCDDVFGALSNDGELFIFTPPESKPASGGEKVAIKPQLVWALRKSFTAVKVMVKGFLNITSVHVLPVGFLNGR